MLSGGTIGIKNDPFKKKWNIKSNDLKYWNMRFLMMNSHDQHYLNGWKPRIIIMPFKFIRKYVLWEKLRYSTNSIKIYLLQVCMYIYICHIFLYLGDLLRRVFFCESHSFMNKILILNWQSLLNIIMNIIINYNKGIKWNN